MKERIINLLEERKVAVILLNTPVKSPKGDIISLGQNTVGYYAVNNPHLQFQFYEDLDQTILIKLIEEATALPQSRQFRRRNLDGSYNDIWEDMAEAKTKLFIEQLLPDYDQDEQVALSNDLCCVIHKAWSRRKFNRLYPQYKWYSNKRLKAELREVESQLYKKAEGLLQKSIQSGQIEVRVFSVAIVSAIIIGIEKFDKVALRCADQTQPNYGHEFTLPSKQMQNITSRIIDFGSPQMQFQVLYNNKDTDESYWCNAEQYKFSKIQ